MNALLVLVLFADARDLVAAGNASLLRKEYDLAEKKYLDAQIDAPDSPIIQFNLGNSFLGRQDYAKARDHYQKALQTRDPAFEAAIKYNIGHTYFGEAGTGLEDLSDMEKVNRTVELLRQAIRRWRDVLKLDPAHADATHNIAVATAVLKDYLDRVKRRQEELAKQQEQEKGKDLAQTLEELKKRQEAEKARTDGIAAAIDERAPLAAAKDRYASAAAALNMTTPDAAAKDAALAALRELLSDPSVVEGASSLQEAERALATPEPDAAKARSAVEAAVAAIGAKADAAAAKTAGEHATGKTNQTQILAETQGVAAGLEAQISGESPQGATPPQPGQDPPQGPPLPPEQKKLLEDVRNLVAQAAEFQGAAIGKQEAGPEDRDAVTATAAAQQGAAEKLGEALELLKKNRKDEQKKDGQNQDQQNEDRQTQDEQNQDEQKQEQQREEKQKSLSREEAENLLRQMQEKERQKKQEKEKMLQQAYGRRKAEKDW